MEVNEITANFEDEKDPNRDDIYLGLSGVNFEVDEFDFGRGIELRKTYAYVFAPYLAAFRRPEKKGDPSPGPWRAVSGGQAKHIFYELHIPIEFKLDLWFDRINTAWWILSLLRLKGSSFLSGPVISNYSYSTIIESNKDPKFVTVEFNRNQLPVDEDANKIVSIGDLNWVKEYWMSSGMLFRKDDNFSDAYRAFDSCIHEYRPSLALMIIWGALERLFADFRQELSYRVSLNIASYLEPLGENRLSFFKKVKKLYDSRSKVAHGKFDEDYNGYENSYIILRRSLIKMIEQNHVPTLKDIENIILKNDPG